LQASAGRELEIGPALREEASKTEKDTKIEGTNSLSPLESTTVIKNELKTNWFFSAKKAKQTPETAEFC